MDSFQLIEFFPVPPEAVYRAWLSEQEHGAITGSGVKMDPQEGGEFDIWDGYITGKNLILEPGKRIVQKWRTTEFPDGAPDSRLELILEGVPEGTKLVMNHSGLPEGQGGEYENGWKEYYFEPMKGYFQME